MMQIAHHFAPVLCGDRKSPPQRPWRAWSFAREEPSLVPNAVVHCRSLPSRSTLSWPVRDRMLQQWPMPGPTYLQPFLKMFTSWMCWSSAALS